MTEGRKGGYLGHGSFTLVTLVYNRGYLYGDY